jgi:hypothetical protein
MIEIIIVSVFLIAILLFVAYRNYREPMKTEIVTNSVPVQSKELPEFIQSDTYTGSKPGYLYYYDKLGLGYYIDTPYLEKSFHKM